LRKIVGVGLETSGVAIVSPVTDDERPAHPETVMIIRDHDRIAHCEDNDSFYRKSLQAELTARIGGDLRGLYGELATSALPDHLVELASRIDAKRRFGESEA
jgi:hypothetical protein